MEQGTVRDNAECNRFELEVEGKTATADYCLAGGVITFTHTETPPALAGRGVASLLIRGALEQVRARRLKVVAQCPFVANFIARNSDFTDLLKDL